MFPRFLGRRRCCIYLYLACCLFHGNVFAADQTDSVINPLETLVKLGFALIVVLVVFWLFARIMKQVQGLQGLQHNGLSIVGALSVGQREKVIVVQAGEEQIVLGVTSSQINTLHILDKPLSKDVMSEEHSDFKAKLSAAMKKQIAK